MSQADQRKIAGALALFWAGGSGPTRAQIQSALLIAGCESKDEGNKQELVQRSIVISDNEMARHIIEELVALLRESNYFDFGGHAEPVARLQRAFRSGGHELSDDGYIRWESSLDANPGPPALAPSRPRPAPASPDPVQSGAGAEANQSAPVEVASPTRDLLISSLRRLGAGAARPLVTRRRSDRPSLIIGDEYDLQDLVEVLLRSLYSDVRPEEPTPSSAGSSSRVDLHLREGRTAVEVKVSGIRHNESPIKTEILVDVNDYSNHPTVDTLIVAVFDLAHVFSNPAGFEHDLSGNRGALDVYVIVIPWLGPRTTV